MPIVKPHNPVIPWRSSTLRVGVLPLQVMFTDAHVRELKPGNMGWRKQVIGEGTYGKVFKAEVRCVVCWGEGGLSES